MPRAASAANRNSRVALPSPQTSTNGARCSFASTNFLMSAGNDVRAARIEVVAHAVEIHRQQVDRVEGVLLPIGLRLHQQHLLRQTVRRVGLLRIAVPQIFFAKRNRRELRIAADGANCHVLLDTAPTGVLERQGAHLQVVVEETSRVLAIGADAADNRREVNDDVRLDVGVQPLHRRLVGQVVLRLPRRDDVPAAAALELGDDVPAEKAAAAGHDDALRGEITHEPRLPAGARPDRVRAPAYPCHCGGNSSRPPRAC